MRCLSVGTAISADDVRRTFEDGITEFILTSVEPTSKLTATWGSDEKQS